MCLCQAFPDSVCRFNIHFVDGLFKLLDFWRRKESAASNSFSQNFPDEGWCVCVKSRNAVRQTNDRSGSPFKRSCSIDVPNEKRGDRSTLRMIHHGKAAQEIGKCVDGHHCVLFTTETRKALDNRVHDLNRQCSMHVFRRHSRSRTSTMLGGLT